MPSAALPEITFLAPVDVPPIALFMGFWGGFVAAKVPSRMPTGFETAEVPAALVPM